MKFICLECNKEFGQITGTHLKTHGINTVEEYLEKHPGAETVRARQDSPETLERKRIARTGKKHSDESKAKIGAKHKGKKRTEEEIDKWRVRYAEFLAINGSPMLGKDRGEEFSEKMRKIAKARSQELIDEKVKQMNDARRGSHINDVQRVNYSDARLKYIEENSDKLNQKLFNTKPEMEFEQILKDNKISYIKNHRLGNRLFDFKINDNILVEIDGPFHYNFKMWGDKSMSDQERFLLFEEGQRRDRHKDKIAIDNGFKLYRIQVGSNLPSDWKEILRQQGFTEF